MWLSVSTNQIPRYIIIRKALWFRSNWRRCLVMDFGCLVQEMAVIWRIQFLGASIWSTIESPAILVHSREQCKAIAIRRASFSTLQNPKTIGESETEPWLMQQTWSFCPKKLRHSSHLKEKLLLYSWGIVVVDHGSEKPILQLKNEGIVVNSFESSVRMILAQLIKIINLYFSCFIFSSFDAISSGKTNEHKVFYLITPTIIVFKIVFSILARVWTSRNTCFEGWNSTLAKFRNFLSQKPLLHIYWPADISGIVMINHDVCVIFCPLLAINIYSRNEVNI